MGDVRVFSLSLYPETEHNFVDYWVKNTVVKVIANFLLNDSNVIFYICDNEDKKEDQRQKVFDYWFSKEKELQKIIGKYDYIFHSPNGYKINSSLLYSKENYLADYIIEQFKKQIEIL